MKLSKEIKAGVIVLLAFAAFYFVFNYMKGENLFVKGRVIYVNFDNVDGLEPSKAVYVQGLRVGRVDEVIINESAIPLEYHVKLIIERDIPFSKETVAEIYSPDIMSGKSVRLLLDYEGIPAENGDTIIGRVSPSILNVLSDQIGPTKDNLDSLMVSFTRTSERLQAVMNEQNTRELSTLLANLNQTISSFNQTSNALRSTTQEVSGLLTENNQKLGKTFDNANAMIASTQTTVEKYGEVADKFQSIDLETTLKNLEESTVSLKGTLQKLENNEGNLGKLLNDEELYKNLNQTTETLDALLTDLKENPKRYVHFSIFGRKDKKDKKQ